MIVRQINLFTVCMANRRGLRFWLKLFEIKLKLLPLENDKKRHKKRYQWPQKHRCILSHLRNNDSHSFNSLENNGTVKTNCLHKWDFKRISVHVNSIEFMHLKSQDRPAHKCKNQDLYSSLHKDPCPFLH